MGIPTSDILQQCRSLCPVRSRRTVSFALLVVLSSHWLAASSYAEEEATEAAEQEVSAQAPTPEQVTDLPSTTPPSSVARGLAMVFDPEMKKYFVGGNAKLTLRQTDQGTMIDRIEVSIDGSEFAEYKGAVQFTEEGKHTVKFRAVNPVISYSPVQYVDVFVDLEPPFTQLQFEEGQPFKTVPSGPGADTSTNFVRLGSQVTLIGHDNLSGVGKTEYSWDTDHAYEKYVRPLTIEKTGKRTLFYRTLDRVGNIEITKRVDFVVDSSAPNSEIKILGGHTRPITVQGVTYNAARDSAAFELTAGDTGAGVKEILISIDGKTPKPYVKPMYFLKEGPHLLKFYAVDMVGNKEEAKQFRLYTVSEAPKTVPTAVGTVVNTGGINFARTNFRLKLEIGEKNPVGLDRIEYRINDEKEFRTYFDPIRLDKPGDYGILFRSQDLAGNREPTHLYRVIITDTAPTTRIRTAQPLVVREGVTYSPSPNIVTFEAENSGVGIESTQYSLNDGPFQRYTGPVTLTSDRKIYKIAFKSVDKLGNEEPAQALAYHMIGAAPVVDLFVSDQGQQAEQIRTQFFEDSGTQQGKHEKLRAPASQPKGKVQPVNRGGLRE